MFEQKDLQLLVLELANSCLYFEEAFFAADLSVGDLVLRYLASVLLASCLSDVEFLFHHRFFSFFIEAVSDVKYCFDDSLSAFDMMESSKSTLEFISKTS